MATQSNWTEDWTSPPTSLEATENWRIYLTIWKDAHLTPPGQIVRAWLKQLGTPSLKNDPEGNYQAAVRAFMWQDKLLRKVSS